MNMDMRTAFEILNLETSVSFVDAKKAYRALAKKYHPDVMGDSLWPDNSADERMKEINLAFRYLAPRLRSINKKSKKTSRKTSRKTEAKVSEKNMFFAHLLKTLGSLLDPSSRKKEKSLKKNQGTGRQKSKNICFDDVFRKFNHGDAYTQVRGAANLEKKRSSKKTKSYNGYKKFMELRRQMRSGQPDRHRDMSITRVEKIEPVKPVNPIGKN